MPAVLLHLLQAMACICLPWLLVVVDSFPISGGPILVPRSFGGGCKRQSIRSPLRPLPVVGIHARPRSGEEERRALVGDGDGEGEGDEVTRDGSRVATSRAGRLDVDRYLEDFLAREEDDDGRVNSTLDTRGEGRELPTATGTVKPRKFDFSSGQFPKIIDQNGRAWRSNLELMVTNNTRRDGLCDEWIWDADSQTLELPATGGGDDPRGDLDDDGGCSVAGFGGDSPHSQNRYYYMDLGPGKSMLRTIRLPPDDDSDGKAGDGVSANLPHSPDRRGRRVDDESYPTTGADENVISSEAAARLVLDRTNATGAVRRATLPPSFYVLDDERWTYHYERLVEFRSWTGHTRVPQNYPPDPPLALWVSKQRYLQTKRERGEYSHLTDRRKELLDRIGFEFEVCVGWDENYAALKAFWRENGNCRVPTTKADGGGNYTISMGDAESMGEGHVSPLVPATVTNKNNSLGNWVYAQRHLRRMDALSAERIKLLDEIEFDWDPYANVWEKRYASLVNFYRQNGHCRVPPKFENEDGDKLGLFVEVQRRQYAAVAEGRSAEDLLPVTRERIEKLNAINFDWNPLDALWESRYRALCRFREERGHCNVPVRYDPDPSLGLWVNSQRRKKLSGVSGSGLSERRIRLLEELGFEWEYDPNVERWEKRYEQLQAFCRRHGHCRVPIGYEGDPTLATWVHWQRQQRKLMERGQKSLMTPHRKKLLDDVGFEWDVHRTMWDRRYEELCDFHSRHGHTRVQQDEDPTLSSWIKTQRRQFKLLKSAKKSSMTEERIKLLTQIGFEFDLLASAWMEQFEALKAYRVANGHCRVRKKSDRSLWTWASNQRQQYKLFVKGETSSMTEERIKLLTQIGFEWTLS